MEICPYLISSRSLYLNSNYISAKYTRLDIYKTFARVVLTYGSEASDKHRLLALEIKFMRLTTGHALLDNKTK
jgi:hypothetical protein